ncbi:glycosyltransferase [Microbacterium bovistercoris]|uniref:Glycosyltransferase n=1 Tax=Microbacterium bovistercoris TaxID=2293570 RepID=A0A371NWR1_9MICO|nr:glycosyltransferase family 4 protein [Microbacterium bovistercoris]REJ07590.1 glycosyltransferase [Microbacterium bovistercoris]
MATRIYRPEAAAASLRLGALVDELVMRGGEVRVLTTRPPKAVAIEPERAEVHRWPVLRDRSGYVRGYLPYLSFDVPLFFRVLFGAGADVYVCEPPPTTGFMMRLAAALRRRPYLYYAADIWSDASAATSAPAFVVRIVRWLESTALRGAAGVLAVNKGVQNRVAALAPESRTHIVGHGVDLEQFSVDGGTVHEPADIVYVGSASEWHGAELAVSALAEVMREDASLTAAFIGQGASWQGMQESVRRHGLMDRIRFIDTVPPRDAARWLRGARVSIATLAPGQGYDFAVPTKLYASVAVGTPVVYSGPEPVRSMIEDNGLGVGTRYEVDAFAAGLRRALAAHSPDGAQRLAAWAEDNVSARAVAARSAAIIFDVAAGVQVQGRRHR